MFISIATLASYPQWTVLNTGTGMELFSVYFTDSLNGYSVGVAATVLKTEDGGLSWDLIPNVPAYALRSVVFPDARIGFAVGQNGSVVKTSDYGLTWADLSPAQIQLYSTHFFDTLTGIAVGGDLVYGAIIRTTDGGNTWIPITNPAVSRLTSVYFINDSIGFIVGDNGKILKTANKGLSWSSVSITGTTFKLESVFFPDLNTGYAAGHFGTIVKTTDGGLTWAPLTSGVNTTFYSIFFTDQNTGYVVGQGGILKTTDGGENWTPQASGASFIPYSIFFTNNQTGYIAGTGGIIIKTTNGGGLGMNQNWERVFNLEIFPNPVKDELNLKIEPFLGKASIYITNIEGQKIKEQDISKNTTALDIRNLPQGIYFLTFISEEIVEVRKIVKE